MILTFETHRARNDAVIFEYLKAPASPLPILIAFEGRKDVHSNLCHAPVSLLVPRKDRFCLSFEAIELNSCLSKTEEQAGSKTVCYRRGKDVRRVGTSKLAERTGLVHEKCGPILIRKGHPEPVTMDELDLYLSFLGQVAPSSR